MRYVCTSDWHLSGTRPLMRTDSDWIETQKKHLAKVRDYAKAHDAAVIVAGDVFDIPTVPPAVLTMVLDFLMSMPNTVFIAGNHDLPYHTVTKMEQCSFGAVRKVSPPFPKDVIAADFGCLTNQTDGRVVVAHAFSVKDIKDAPPMREALTAVDWYSRYPEAELIVIGDNHMPWSVRTDGPLIVNCGCLIQRTATEAQRTCGFYYVDTKKGVCEYVDLSNLSDGCIDLSYLDKAKEREVRAAAYEGLVEQLKGSVGKSYDFPSTLREYTEQNRSALGDSVADFLDEVVDYIKED